jgi:hypothetical protein
MSFVSDILEKIKGVWGRVAGFVKTLPGKFSPELPQKPHIPAVPANIKRFRPAPNGKILLIGLGAALLILIIGLMNHTSDAPAKGTDTLSRAIPSSDLRPHTIPPEELFLPEEPDFLPGVIPGRERRDVWTAEDAAPFWYNPLEEGAAQWRDRIESVIDELLEHVP